jgi:DNA-binding NtrC family response regulator
MHPEALTSTNRLRGSVLLVDDDDGVRKVLTRWSVDLGHQVQAAANAEEAMEIMRRGIIDVAVCDVRMPGHDGVWLVDQIRRNYPYTSIVMATGLTELDPMVTLRSGVVGYIVKPFDRAELDDVLQRGLAACSQRSKARPVRKALPEATTPQRSATASQPQSHSQGRLLSEPFVEGVVLARYSC